MTSATPPSTARAVAPPEKRRPDSAKSSGFQEGSSKAGRLSPARWDTASSASAPVPQKQRRTPTTEGESVRSREFRRSASFPLRLSVLAVSEDTADPHEASNSATSVLLAERILDSECDVSKTSCRNGLSFY